jgi:ribosomal protein S18 acetylase RimI-like enzyme
MSVPYEITSITSEEELGRVLSWCDSIFPGISREPHHQWLENFRSVPELFVYARQGEQIIGCVFGLAKPDNNITIAPVAVDAECRRQGIATALLTEVENRARQLKYNLVALGAVREAEPLYLSCGYQPHLFVQAPAPITLDDLQALNPQYRWRGHFRRRMAGCA